MATSKKTPAKTTTSAAKARAKTAPEKTGQVAVPDDVMETASVDLEAAALEAAELAATEEASEFTQNIAGPPGSGPLTPEEVDDYRLAARKWMMQGEPENSTLLLDHIERDVRAPGKYLFGGDIRPEKLVSGKLSTPPRTGKAATKKAWQEFILATADMEEDVVKRLSRDDLIATAEAKGIIPKLREKE